MTVETKAHYFSVASATYDPLPEYGGGKAVLYHSPDRKRMAGSFKESGAHSMILPFDEFIYVIAGSTKVSITGGDSFELQAGGACYLKQGQEVAFEMSDDFHDVAVLIGDEPFDV